MEPTDHRSLVEEAHQPVKLTGTRVRPELEALTDDNTHEWHVQNAPRLLLAKHGRTMDSQIGRRADEKQDHNQERLEIQQCRL